MQFENILTSIGGFGLYQKFLCFTLIPLTTGLCGLVYYAQLIVLSAPKFECVTELTSESSGFLNESSLTDNVSNLTR